MPELPKNIIFLNAPAVNYLQEMGRYSVNSKLKQ